MNLHTNRTIMAVLTTLIALPQPAAAGGRHHSNPCMDLPSHTAIQSALTAAQSVANGGFGLNMWIATVNRDGIVCGVAFTGSNRGDQWPGSRAIAAQKASTANSFSLPGLALSTANLFTAVQPGNSLFGLQHSNPVDTKNVYAGPSSRYGQANDPLVGRKSGGVNVFGGGLALYNTDGEIVGALGVSGDSSCADHNIAWKARFNLNLDNVPGGVNPVSGDDNIVYDIGTGDSGWGHPECAPTATLIGVDLPVTHPTGPLP